MEGKASLGTKTQSFFLPYSWHESFVTRGKSVNEGMEGGKQWPEKAKRKERACKTKGQQGEEMVGKRQVDRRGFEGK